MPGLLQKVLSLCGTGVLLESLQTEGLSSAQKGGALNFYHRQKPDVFEMLTYSKTHLFVSQGVGRFLIISALGKTVAVARHRAGEPEALQTTYTALPAREMGLHDGNGWNLEALAHWLKNDLRTCPVCGRAVVGRRQIYDRNSCKQKAYRERSK